MPIALLMEATNTFPEIGTLGVGGGIAALIFYFYRQDRIANEKRFEQLAADFRAVIQQNTASSQALVDAIKTVVRCPVAEEFKKNNSKVT